MCKSQLRKHSLTRYLPPLDQGVAANWDDKHLRGKFILDPFGASPNFSVELANQGARLITAANNPITRLLIEIAALPPTSHEAHVVLSKLATVRVRDQRLEGLIKNLYATSCPECSQTIQATSFIWEKDAIEPFARQISCSHCQTSGEFPTTEADKIAATKFKAGGLHFARALERVAPINDPDRIHVEEALSVYPPRSVYVIQTLVNKLDALEIDSRERKIIEVMLLHAFDQANTLWSHPSSRERPKQLTIPPIFRENNIWLALEQAADIWKTNSTETILTYWPEIPPDNGGICIFDGRIKTLSNKLSDLKLAAVLTVFPRPNQAYWSLCALWAGWLWGVDAVEHFKSVLRRRRYDWSWYTSATQAALGSFAQQLEPETPIKGHIKEAEPGFITAALISAYRSKFRLKNTILDTDEKSARFTWQLDKNLQQISLTSRQLSDQIRLEAIRFLETLGEPCSYLRLHTAVLTGLANENHFPVEENTSDIYSKTQQTLQNVLSDQSVFLRFGGSEKSLEVGQWWLHQNTDADLPLSDRVEMWFVRYLIQNSGCTSEEIENMVRLEFPDLTTPSRRLIAECLDSYGEPFENGWRIKEIDFPQKRITDLETMSKTIVHLGELMGLKVLIPTDESQPFIWENQFGEQKFLFFISASALLGKYLLGQQSMSIRKVIIIPGGRANLVMFKLKQDPRLQMIVEDNWQFVKFRQIRQLSQSAHLSIEYFETQLGLDPLTYQETQLRMF